MDHKFITYNAYLMLHILGTGVYEVRLMSDPNPTSSYSEGVWVQALKASGDSYEAARTKLLEYLKEYSKISATHKLWLGMLTDSA